MNRIDPIKIIDGATTTVNGQTFSCPKAPFSVQCTQTGVGAISATLIIEVTNDNVGWDVLCTFTMSGTVLDTKTYGCLVDYQGIRGRVIAVSGGPVNATMVN